jgi:hypothetical protein
LHIDGAKDGDWLNSSLVPAAGDSFIRRLPDDRSSETLKKYGIPARIDVAGYLRSNGIPLEKVSVAEEIVVLNQHYGYNKLIRQDELTGGSMIRSRFLEPSVTEEENILNPLCDRGSSNNTPLGFRPCNEAPAAGQLLICRETGEVPEQLSRRIPLVRVRRLSGVERNLRED